MLCHVPRQHHRSAGQQALQQQGGSVGDAGAGGDLLADVAASHAAADHLGMVRQLADMLHLLAVQVLAPAVQQQGGSPALAAAGACIPGLFDAAGQPAAAAVVALRRHYQGMAGASDIDATYFLTQGSSHAAVPAATAGHPAAAPAAAAAGTQPDGAAATSVHASEGAAADAPALAPVAAEPAGPEEPLLVLGEGGVAAAATPPRGTEAADARTSNESAAPGPSSIEQLEGAAAGVAGLPDASYHTPSPAKRLRAVQPLQPQPTPNSAGEPPSGCLCTAVMFQKEQH